MPRRQREQGKRQWVDEEDETVDDLAHAATFAMMTMVPNPTPFVSDTVIADDASNKDATFLDTVNQTGRDVCDDDKDDIEIESSIDDEKSICGENKATENHNHNDEDENDDDDDDDQSDVDLAEELAKMDADENGDDEDENENEEGRNTGGSNIPRPPKTENEVDAYRTPIQELEKHLQFRLTVTLEESDTTLKNRSLISSNLQLAGRIKHYMGFDRTVVVESAVTNPHGDASSFKHDNAPLDEGTLLLIRMPQDMDNKTENDQLLIPLGRIFEVFGPVSQPLYTIRLPTHPKNSDESKLAASKVRKQNVAPLAHSEKKPLLQPDENEECHVQDETTDTKCKDAESPTSEDLRNKTVGNVNKADLHSTDLNEDDSATVHNLADKDNEVQKLLAGNGEASPTKTLITTQDEEDDWSSDGKYAKLLKEKISLPVYYVKNEAKLIDTGFILRNSRKGCDASNLYDEEVINTNEMYYSDDEEERQAKNRRKSKGSNQVDPTPQQQPNHRYSLPSGFHHASTSIDQRSLQPPSVAPLPPGFHHPPPPPPPPSRGPYGFHTGINNVPPLMSRAPPPPPPPPPSGGSQPPPAYQY